MPVDETKVLDKEAGFALKDVAGISQERAYLSSEFWKRLPDYLEQKRIMPIQDAFEIMHGLGSDGVNRMLDAYKEEKTVKHAHVHI